MDKKVNETIDPIEVLLADPSTDRNGRTSLVSDCSKTITQYKFDLMAIKLECNSNYSTW